MVSGEAGGKKRKASAAAEDITARREPRRGMGVAELERIRVALEMAERCYAAAAASSTLSLSAPRHHPPPPALPLVVHAAGVAAAPAHHHRHQYKNLQVGNNGAVHQLQMTRGYLTPYFLAQHYHVNDSLTSRLFTTNGGHPSSHQNHRSSHHNHYRQTDQIQSAVTALPVTGQAASSESSSSASQRQGPLRAHAKPGQTMAAAPPQVTFVDLVDSDDDDTAGGEVKELDLELKL